MANFRYLDDKKEKIEITLEGKEKLNIQEHEHEKLSHYPFVLLCRTEKTFLWRKIYIDEIKGMSLTELMVQEKFTQRDVIILLMQMYLIFYQMRRDYVNIEKISLDKNLVFVNQNTREIYVTYLSLDNYKERKSLKEFLQNFIRKIQINDKEDRGYLFDINLMIETMNFNNEEECKSFYQQLDRKLWDNIQKIYSWNGTLCHKKTFLDEYGDVFNKEIDEVNNRIDEVDLEQTSVLSSKLDLETSIIGWNIDSISEDTHEKNLDNNLDEKRDSILVSLDTGVRQEINKKIFFIGSDRTSTDFTISWNKTVSRCHCKIEKSDDGLYIYDLNSKNGTFVNGHRVEYKTRKYLAHKDLIELGSEKLLIDLICE